MLKVDKIKFALAMANNGLTIRELSKLSKVSTSVIISIRKGEHIVRPNTIYKLAQAMGCKVEDLVYFD